MEPATQILLAPYDDGMLITIDGKPYFHHMTEKQMLELSQELIEKGIKSIRREKYGVVR